MLETYNATKKVEALTAFYIFWIKVLIKPVEVEDSDKTTIENLTEKLTFAFLNGGEEDIL